MLHRVTTLFCALATITVIAVACTEEEPPPEATPDSGVDPSSIQTGVCPIVPPHVNTSCLLPEGTTCAFACGSSIVTCSSGVWRAAGNPPPHPPCPDPIPAANSACPSCWPASVTCRYGSEDCTSPDASANTAVASCPDGSWEIAFSPCADASAVDSGDAGTNVQGDADADAD